MESDATHNDPDERKEEGKIENEETKGEGMELRNRTLSPPPTQPDFLSSDPQRSANTQILTSPSVLPRTPLVFGQTPNTGPGHEGAGQAQPDNHLDHSVSDNHPR